MTDTEVNNVKDFTKMLRTAIHSSWEMVTTDTIHYKLALNEDGDVKVTGWQELHGASYNDFTIDSVKFSRELYYHFLSDFNESEQTIIFDRELLIELM